MEVPNPLEFLCISYGQNSPRSRLQVERGV
jgi:hypothetical protein